MSKNGSHLTNEEKLLLQIYSKLGVSENDDISR
jgi:hypothetical protein